jgi:hypothetical protein
MLTPQTEQRLVRMWTAAHYGGDWLDLNHTLWQIAKVLDGQGQQPAADEFALLAAVAMHRAVAEVRAHNMLEAA